MDTEDTRKLKWASMADAPDDARCSCGSKDNLLIMLDGSYKCDDCLCDKADHKPLDWFKNI